jgi:hypothetical protein
MGQAPSRRVQGLTQRYFRAKAQALDEDRCERPWRAGEDPVGWHTHLFEALGYTTCRAMDLPVEGDSAVVPALGRGWRIDGNANSPTPGCSRTSSFRMAAPR